MISHHLSDDLLWAYATGSLPAGHSLLVSCHVEMCSSCAKRLGEAEMLAGAMLQVGEQAKVSENAFDALMGQIDQTPIDAGLSAYAPPSSRGNGLPGALWDVLGHDFDDVKWKMVGPGVRQFLLPIRSSEGELARLLKLSPGFVTPEHSHHGSELTLVLKGSFSDETGRYKLGDVQEADDTIHHQPVADTEQECICLAVTDAPLEFKGFIPKLLQPWLNI